MQRITVGAFLAVATLTHALATPDAQSRLNRQAWEGRQRNEQVIEQLLVQSGWLSLTPQAASPSPQPLTATAQMRGDSEPSLTRQSTGQSGDL